MSLNPVWWRPPGEYTRHGTVRVITGPQVVYAVGCYAYPEGYVGRRPGQDVSVELIPEPSNPHDPSAVSLEVDRRRIGYLTRRVAATWHPIVAHLNANGERVEAPGTVVRLAYDEVDADHDLGVCVSLPFRSSALIYRAVEHLGATPNCPQRRISIHRGQFRDVVARLVDAGQEVVRVVTVREGMDPAYKRGPRPCLDVFWDDELIAVVPSGRDDYHYLCAHLTDPAVVPVLYVRSDPNWDAGDRMVQLWAVCLDSPREPC